MPTSVGRGAVAEVSCAKANAAQASARSTGEAMHRKAIEPWDKWISNGGRMGTGVIVIRVRIQVEENLRIAGIGGCGAPGGGLADLLHRTLNPESSAIGRSTWTINRLIGQIGCTWPVAALSMSAKSPMHSSSHRGEIQIPSYGQAGSN